VTQAATAASRLKTRKAGTAPTVQASTNFINNSSDEDNLISQRTQRLVRMLGLTNDRARTVAALAWEGC